MTNGIISLTVENIKKIKAVTIRPSGNVVEIYAYLRNVREEILMH